VIVTEFLSVIANYLKNDAGLTPAPKTVGSADPLTPAELPAIVLSVSQIQQLGNGLGERSQVITDGALPWKAAIDLANPTLPEEPSFRLLSPDRRELILTHGGLVRADGNQGPLAETDFSVSVAGASRKLVSGTPTTDQVRVDPQVGRLFFGSPLPATGSVVANYFLGQWEQRVSRMSGSLLALVRDTNPATVSDLSAAVVEALQVPRSKALEGLHGMQLITLGRIQPPDAAMANSRARELVLSFEFELQINRPESSGGIILRIPVEENLDAPTVA